MSFRNPRIHQAALIVGVVLVGMNLRPAITAISPLAERIHADGLSRELVDVDGRVRLRDLHSSAREVEHAPVQRIHFRAAVRR